MPLRYGTIYNLQSECMSILSVAYNLRAAIMRNEINSSKISVSQHFRSPDILHNDNVQLCYGKTSFMDLRWAIPTAAQSILLFQSDKIYSRV
jgi:hypothetical protein